MKKKYLKIIPILIALIIISNITRAETTIEINIEEPKQFGPGSKIIIPYSITSTESELPKHTVMVYCEDSPHNFLPQFDTKMEWNEEKKKYEYESEFSYITVDEETTKQKCVTAIYFLDEQREEYGIEEFEIINIPKFETQIEICTDQECNERRGVFTQQETVYLDYQATANVEIGALLEYPNGFKRDIQLPFLVDLKEAEYPTGKYKIEIDATANGYKTEKRVAKFSIIEKEPTIQRVTTTSSTTTTTTIPLVEGNDFNVVELLRQAWADLRDFFR
tara:strand:- start:12614 stop:13444 length:831 start_codon:yes stop_codon:yes gene_type:complete